MRRGQSGQSLILAIDKPIGLSSHDVVNRVRGIAGEKRVGHAGTLDPAASGLLVVCVGPATRLSPYLIGHDKSYRARIRFGSATNTDDEEGEIIATAPVDDEVCDPFLVESFVEGLVGEHMQVPPAFCAIKRDGQTSYRLARAGIDPQLEERPFRIYEAVLCGIEVADEPVWELSLRVSKGTYIRALARDIGEALGTKAHLCGLRRTACGNLTSDDACSLDDLTRDGVQGHAIDPMKALGLPVLFIDVEEIAPLTQGRTLTAPTGTPEGLMALAYEDRLLSIHRCQDGRLIPQTVIPGGVICGGI